MNIVYRKTYDMFVRPNTSDDFICDEAQDYRALFINANKFDTFFDIGANIGSVSKLADKEVDNIRIVAYEPEGENFNLLKANARSIKNMITIKGAIGNNYNDIELKVDKGTFKAKHSIENREFKHGFDSYLVKQYDFLNEIEKYNGNIIKMDIEGFEYKINFSCLPNRIKGLAIEIHLIEGNHKKMLDLYLLLKSQFGFVTGQVPEDETLEYFKETFTEEDSAFMVIFLRNTK